MKFIYLGDFLLYKCKPNNDSYLLIVIRSMIIHLSVRNFLKFWWLACSDSSQNSAVVYLYSSYLINLKAILCLPVKVAIHLKENRKHYCKKLILLIVCMYRCLKMIMFYVVGIHEMNYDINQHKDILGALKHFFCLQ